MKFTPILIPAQLKKKNKGTFPGKIAMENKKLYFSNSKNYTFENAIFYDIIFININDTSINPGDIVTDGVNIFEAPNIDGYIGFYKVIAKPEQIPDSYIFNFIKFYQEGEVNLTENAEGEIQVVGNTILLDNGCVVVSESVSKQSNVKLQKSKLVEFYGHYINPEKINAVGKVKCNSVYNYVYFDFSVDGIMFKIEELFVSGTKEYDSSIDSAISKLNKKIKELVELSNKL